MEGQHPKPPRKPLTPYMRYSKSIWKSVKEAKDQIWQSVKEANPSLSVCEIGATIGKMWRELDDATKQKYNEDFVQDKVRYDEELQAYLKMTGLQASDLAKPKSRKKAESKQSRANHQAATPPPGQGMNIQQQAMGMPQMPPPGYPGQAVGMQLPPNFPANSQASAAAALPHFSQIWTTGQFDGQGGQMMMLNAQGQPMQIPNGQAAAMAFFQPQLQQLQQQAQQVQQQQAEQQAQPQQEQQQAQQPQQQQAADQIPSYNGSPQMPAAAGSPHLNTASPLSQEQVATSVPAPPTYEQQLRDKVQQQQQQQQQQLDQWALHQQVLQQQQLAVQQSQQPSSNGSDPKASPPSHTTDPNSPVAASTTTAENSSEQKHIASPTGDSNSASSATTNTDAQVTSHQMPPQYASAHNNFNSYANFPWGNFPQAVQAQLQAEAQAQAQAASQSATSSSTTAAAAATDTNGKPVFSKESILESELSHLRTALSEQTKEVQRLSQELEKAYSVIEQLKVDRAQLQAQYNAQAQAHAHVQAQAQAHMQQVQAQAQAQAQAAHAAQSGGPLALTMQPSPQEPPSSSPGPM